MQILRSGNVKESKWSIKTHCVGWGWGNIGQGCGSLLVVDEDDLDIKYEDRSSYFFFVCPVCGIENDIWTQSIPVTVRDKVKNK